MKVKGGNVHNVGRAIMIAAYLGLSVVSGSNASLSSGKYKV